MQITDWEDTIFQTSSIDFERKALELFHFQYHDNNTYQSYVNTINVLPETVDSIDKIPFLPIQFFKSRTVQTTGFDAEIIFESSGTTQTVNSKHHVKKLNLYKESFKKGFELFYGKPDKYCILALLPSYLERKNSSLITMTEELIKESNQQLSGFFLNDHNKLYKTLLHNELTKQPTLLLGVTYALLDFAEKFCMNMNHTIVMETGGMKGRRKELMREEVHDILKKKLGLKTIHSEYGMTEILSQAYSYGRGLFKCPPWMKILLRNEDDPLAIKNQSPDEKKFKSGIINIIDLANIYSCAFIATDDIGKLHQDEIFEVLGRCDNSDIRGCSLLID